MVRKEKIMECQEEKKQKDAGCNHSRTFLSFKVVSYLRGEEWGFEIRSPLCSPEWPETYSVDQADLKLTEIHLLLPPECWD